MRVQAFDSTTLKRSQQSILVASLVLALYKECLTITSPYTKTQQSMSFLSSPSFA